MYIDYTLWNTLQGDKWGAEMTRTGPNDTRRIVWAISNFFFSFFSSYICILTDIYCSLCTEATITTQKHHRAQ